MWSLGRSALLLRPPQGLGLRRVLSPELHISATLDRARKATRERKRKVALANKKKKEERLRKNPPPLPKSVVDMLFRDHGIRDGKPLPMRADEEGKRFPRDDVYQRYLFCYERMEFNRAVNELRGHYHPSMLDRPEDVLFARVEFNMQAVKKEKYMEDFSKMVPVVHPFGIYAATKNVCAFVNGEEEAEKAKAAGAALAGGEELIKDIITGKVELAELDHFVCHDELLVQMKSLAGLLRDKAPSKASGTVGSDVSKMVRTFRSGMQVQVKKPVPSLLVAKEPDFGWCEVPLGLLSQEEGELKANLDMLLETLEENRPRREQGGWITRVTLQLEDGSPHARFSIAHDLIYDKKLQEHRKALEEEQEEKASQSSRPASQS